MRIEAATFPTRRLDARSIDLATGATRLIMLALCCVWLVSMSGCANYASIELAHSSHPLDGPPFGPRNEEDSLDRLNVCLGREQNGWYVDSCVGYRYVDGGFYGSNFTFDGRVGRKFKFGENR
mgnify:CR=1 FL=1